jgi:hypothetical protein
LNVERQPRAVVVLDDDGDVGDGERDVDGCDEQQRSKESWSTTKI